MSEELLQIVDRQGNPVGTAPRSECHGNPELIQAVVHLHIFDAKGRLVDVLIDGVVKDLGVQYVSWDGRRADGSRVSSGVYFYRLKAGHYTQTRKFVKVQ